MNSASGAFERDVEFRIMPNGDGRWYWEVIQGGRAVITRGVAEDEPSACKDASNAAREQNLIQ